MTISATNFLIQAGIDDFLEVLIPIAFVVIYLIGSAAKSLSEKKQQDRHHEKLSSHLDASAPSNIPKRRPYHPPQPVVNRRIQRLPYAKSIPQSPSQQEEKSFIQKMEELKQQRLEQIRAQQQQRRTISPPPVQRHPIPQAAPPRPSRPRPVHRPSQQIPVANAIPVPVAPPTKPSYKAKQTVQKTHVPRVSERYGYSELRGLLKNPKYIRNAIVAAEILGKPISLR